MVRRGILAFAMSFLVAAALTAQSSAEAKKESTKAKTASKEGVRGLVVMPSADLKWMDMDPQGAPGVKIADLWGDHTKGAFGAFIKFPAGFQAPLHTHTYPYKIVVISGTFIQQPEGKAEFRLGPGSYESQPGGSYKHVTRCDTGSECLFFTESPGKFDLKPVAAAKTATKPAKKM